MSVKNNEVHDWLRRARLAIVEVPFMVLELDKQPFDANAMVEDLERCNVDVIRVGAARTYAWFQSEIAPIAPSIGDRDILEEVISAARPRGIKVVPYMQLGYENVTLYQQHPDWVERVLDGRPMAVGRPEEVHMCWNSPYREWKISVIKEICSNYDVAGMYLDGPTYFGYCYCDYCRRKFRSELNMDIPQKEDWQDPSWQEYILWRYKVLASVLKDICEAVQEARSGIPVINNNITYFHGRCRRESRIPELLTQISDGMLLESHRSHHKLPWNRVGQNAKYGYATGKPLWMWWEYNIGEWSFTACSDAELRLKYAEIRANGGTPGIFDVMSFERAPQGVGAIRECFTFQAENEERLFSVQPMKFLGLPYSRQTAEWYGADEPEERYTAGHTGMYRSLIHGHVPFNLLLDSDFSEEGLEGYKVLILTNLACLSDDQTEAIRKFVHEGGGLIATYETSLFDERGRRRPNFALADVFGADYQATARLEVRGELAPGYPILETRQEWVMWFEEPVAGGKPEAISYIEVPPGASLPFEAGIDEALLPISKHTYVKTRSGAEGVGVVLKPSLLAHPLGEPTPYPGAVTNTYGKGRVVYFPADIGHDYSQARMPYVTTYLMNALRWVVNHPWPIHVEAPTSVEVQLHEGEDRLLIYLINFTGDSVDPRDEVTRVARLYDVSVRVHVARPVDQALWLNRKRNLEWSMEENYCTFTVPELDEYAVISIEYGT